MKTSRLTVCVLSVLSVLTMVTPARAQIVTNWVAYNDHRARTNTIPPHIPVRTNWGTHVNVTRYDMGAPSDTPASNLTNFLDGQQLPVTMAAVRTGAPDDFGTVSNFGPLTNSPAGQIFFGKVDLSNDGIVGVDSSDGAFVTLTFGGLDPAKRYLFRGTAARGGGYLPRWSVATINSDGFIDAHLVGAGSPGILNSNSPGANLVAGQAAWNSGDNVEGDVIGWDFITPFADGTFNIVCAQYLGPIPNGVADSDYAYGFGGILLAEVEVTPPVITTHPAANTTVEQNRPFSLSVTASGTPLLYQWYKVGSGEIAGATLPSYSVSAATLADSGDYYVVVYNPLDRATSTVAQVTVNADVTAPGIRTAFSYPRVDFFTQAPTLDRVIVDFTEAIQPATAGGTSQYTISSGIGNPTSVEVTSDRTVTLNLASALAEDTTYTVQVSGVLDLVGNDIAGGANNPATFRSWGSGPGNGVIFEAFTSGTGNTIDVLTNSPNFPNNPFLVTNLYAFDTRVIFPDNSQENYGGRVSGAFIPPVSGLWVFRTRIYDRGVVYFNPNGPSAGGKQQILAETTGNEPRDWNKFESPPFFLLAGEPYYIEGLYQNGGGGDVIKVAATLAGTTNTLGVAITDVDTNALYGAAIGYPLAPKDAGGTLTIAQQPANATVEELNTGMFSVEVNNPSGLPVIYQWYKNGVPIPGANGRTYSFQALTEDDNATFSVRAAKLGSQVMSASATLDVVPDVTPPRLINVRTVSPFTDVVVTFSEAIQWTGGENEMFNYTVNELLPAAAAIDGTARIVTLTLQAPLTAGSSNWLAANAFVDLIGNTSATNLPFYAGPAPLSIVRQGSGIRVSWPLPGTGVTLEEATTLTAPVPWQNVPAASYQTGPSSRYVDIAAPAGNRFYRLREP